MSNKADARQQNDAMSIKTLSSRPHPILDKIKNGMSNTSLQNLIGVEKINLSCLNENKENKNNDNKSTKLFNNRLLYHLHDQYVPCEKVMDIWPVITHDYNVLTSSEYKSNDMEALWKTLSTMEKRKLALEAFQDNTSDNSLITKIKRTKKTKSVSFDLSKQSKKNKQSNSNEIPTLYQSQPFDFSTSCHQSGDNKLKNTGQLSKKRIKTTCDQQTQTDLIDDLNELAKNEYQLKISILKLKLDYLEKQFQNKFSMTP